MARPAPNSSENSANALSSTAWVRIVSMARSIGEASILAPRNWSKIETRNSITRLMAMTPNRAMPRSTSMASIRSAEGVGLGRYGAIGRHGGIPIVARRCVARGEMPATRSVIASAAKQSRISPWRQSGLFRTRSDGGERASPSVAADRMGHVEVSFVADFEPSATRIDASGDFIQQVGRACPMPASGDPSVCKGNPCSSGSYDATSRDRPCAPRSENKS